MRRGLLTTGLIAAGVAAGAAGAAALRSRRALDLRGKRVLVTGGSRGLGLELAREFATQGASVGLLARNSEELERAAEEVRFAARNAGHDGVGVLTLSCDLREPTEVEAALSDFVARFGGIDILVNVAGTLTVGPVQELDLDDFREQMNGNFYGALHATLAALPHLRLSPTARIVNITSIGGRMSVPHLLPYTAAKFALVGFSQGLRAELARDGIKVTTVTPGLMRTGSPYRASFTGRQEQEFGWFLLADSLPGLSMSSAAAARKIVAACRRGDASLILPSFIRLPVAAAALFPGLTAEFSGLANRFLPAPTEDGAGRETREGRAITPPERAPAWAGLTTRAAKRNNQLG